MTSASAVRNDADTPIPQMGTGEGLHLCPEIHRLRVRDEIGEPARNFQHAEGDDEDRQPQKRAEAAVREPRQGTGDDADAGRKRQAAFRKESCNRR